MEYSWRKRKLRDTESLKRKMLQLLGIERAHVRSVGVSEEAGILMDVSLDYSHSRQTKTALLEAEHKKAKALMEIKRQQMRVL